MSTAQLNGTCRDCSWPVVDACCNDGLAVTEPYCDWDWWIYCSNPTCVNHVGEGVFQNNPEWWICARV